MKGAILSSIITASAVAAQVTLGPEVLGVAAININDPEYTTCSVVADFVDECVTALGGSDALATANPNDVLACACCVSATPVYPLYSACSSYLSDEGGVTYSDSYSAYSVLYSACDAAALCTSGSNSGDNDSSSASGSENIFTSSATQTDDSSAAASTTSFTTEQTYAVACSEMIDVYTSCTNKVDDFTDLPFTEQARCYCCQTEHGTLSWTDALDKYASTCAAWAKTGEPETAYPVAKTFATFCERFSDVCDQATATSDSDSASVTDNSADSTSDSDSGDSNTDAVTVTVQPTKTGSSSDSGNGAGSLHVGSCGALLAAVLALAIAM